MSDRIVTLTSFNNSIEAYSLMEILAAEGIESYVADDISISVEPNRNYAYGGVKVNIRECDTEKALLILRRIEDEQKSRSIDLDTSWEKDFMKVDGYCPKCESYPIYRKKFPWDHTLFALILAWLNPILSIFINKRYCAKCRYVWG
jgi:hypothetical protein